MRSSRYKAYIAVRKENEGSPAFFLDVATYFYTISSELGVRVITTLLDMKLEDARLLRIVGNSVWCFPITVHNSNIITAVIARRRAARYMVVA